MQSFHSGRMNDKPETVIIYNNIELAEEQSIALIEEAQLMEEECNKVKYTLGESGSSLKRQEKRSRLMK